MTGNVDEQLSALMDGELEQRQHDAVMAALTDEQGLRSTWRNYHLIGEALRGEERHLGIDVSAATRRELDTLPTVLAPRWSQPRIKRMARPLAGTAIAASVAVATVLGWERIGALSTAPDAARMADAKVVEPGRQLSAAQDTGMAQLALPELTDAELQRQEAYLVQHIARTPADGIPGVMKATRVVSVGK